MRDRKFSKKEVMAIVRQVIRRQVGNPPISYKITDYDHMKERNYTSKYIDVGDFKSYLKRLEQQLKSRFY